MPEKPEVITVARTLKKQLLGRKIISCHVYWNNIIASPSASVFCKKIANQVIYDITTRGKFLVFELDDDYLLIHLRMEGKFLFRNSGDPILKHEHVEMIFDNLDSFRYMDVRKFGKMYLIPKKELYSVKPINQLGYDYDDERLNTTYLYEKIHHRKLPIKTVLLDQSVIAGIGNIYANEILYLSKIHPCLPSSKITKKDCSNILSNLRIVFQKAIELGGTTIRSFTSSEGVHGLFQNELNVHGKEGESCPCCHNKIVKIAVGGRGTYYCPNCQKK